MLHANHRVRPHALPFPPERTGSLSVLTHLGLLVDVPGEGNGVVGDLLDVADGVEALLVVSC